MSFTQNKRVIIIAGPTASGKTSTAIRLAKYFQAEIISADSRQCYRELNIGVARPALSELKEVPHHFIASHSIHENVTAATFEEFALTKANELFNFSDTVVMAGGTGLYIKAFCEGLDSIPETDPDIRHRIIRDYGKWGLVWLQQEIQKKDPAYFAAGEIKNPQRMMRALEVVESTGHSILHFRKGEKAKRDFTIIKIGLAVGKEELTQRISSRVDQMINDGLADEVRELIPYSHITPLQTVGYKEFFEYFHQQTTLNSQESGMTGKKKNAVSLEETMQKIKISTRQYAKRQMTWFRKDPGIEWFAPGDIESMIRFIEDGA